MRSFISNNQDMTKAAIYCTMLLLVLISTVIPSSFCLADESLPLKVKVAVLKDSPPQYAISPKGEPQGFAIDIIEAVAQLARLKIEYKILNSWEDMSKALKAGHVDLIPNQGITERRKKIFSFSLPIET